MVVYDSYPYTRVASARLLKCLGAQITCAESLSFLESLPDDYDYLFANLSQKKPGTRQLSLDVFRKFSAKDKVLMYSGTEPLDETNLDGNFKVQQRMPITPSKLERIFSKNVKTKHNELEEKIKQLPACRVLAVDDMEMNLRLLKTWLKPSPMELTVAYSGEESVYLCGKYEYDLILMDVQMPNMDGLQASKLIRQTDLNMGTPIIAVTAHAFKEEQERLLSSGMDDYLPKPIDLAALIELIKGWCHQEQHLPIQLPSIDWQLALKRSNQNEPAARDLMSGFYAQFPRMLDSIEASWRLQDLSELQSKIHQLNGACCYTGVPKLHSLVEEIESALKLGQESHVSQRLPKLIAEGQEVMKEMSAFLHTQNFD